MRIVTVVFVLMVCVFASGCVHGVKPSAESVSIQSVEVKPENDAISSDKSQLDQPNVILEQGVFTEPEVEQDPYWNRDDWEYPGILAERLSGTRNVFSVNEGGPSFVISLKNGTEYSIKPQNSSKVKSIILKGNFPSDTCNDGYCAFWDDFNQDGYLDLAFLVKIVSSGIQSDSIYHVFSFLLWNPTIHAFSIIELPSVVTVLRHFDNDLLLLSPPAFEAHYGFAQCPSFFVFEFIKGGVKAIRQTFPLPRENSSRARVIVDESMMDTNKFSHLGSLIFEFQNTGNNVEGYVIDCAMPLLSVYIEDAVVEGMIQKDINGDSLVDLQFHAKSDPSVLRTVFWDRNLNRFEDPENPL